MDDALAQSLLVFNMKKENKVLILVVMDDALARCKLRTRGLQCSRLNPCCNG